MELDRDLIRAVRRFITGANVHSVSTWLFCYEMSLPDSPRRRRYEALLRDFVSSKARLEVAMRNAETQRKQLESISDRLVALHQRIDGIVQNRQGNPKPG